jgi:uncharacterized protein
MRRQQPYHHSEKARHSGAAPLPCRPPKAQPQERCWLIIMAKQPVMGRVKTRLAGQVGPATALRFYRNCLRTVVRRLGSDPRWTTIIAVAPDTGTAVPVWPRGVSRCPQGSGDLGARMQRLLAAPPPGRVLLVGTDIPSIQPWHIAQAFQLLGGHDAVLGPAEDGGYWLVGLKRRPRLLRPFGGVRWSARETLTDTLANLSQARVAFAATLSDVDSAVDLDRLGPMAARVTPSAI